MPPKTNIPKYKLNEQAQKGMFVTDLAHYNRYQKHTVTEPHRDDHFSILIVRSGLVELMIDFENVKISKPAFLLIAPEQVHQMIRIHQAKGWLINADASVLRKELVDNFHDHFAKQISLSAQSNITTQFFSLLQIILSLETEKAKPFIERSAHTVLHAALELVLSLITPPPATHKKQVRGQVIYRQFRSLLEEHYKTWKQPSRYADEIAVSATHLNDTVKEVSGLSVSQHIQARSILESQRLLYFTDKTVSEIGFELGYEDPVYFGKLFKKNTQLTPLAFRQKFRE